MKLKEKSQDSCQAWQSYHDNDVEKFRQLIKDGYDVNGFMLDGKSLIEHILMNYGQIDKNIEFFDELINDNVDFKSIIKQKFLLSMAVNNPSEKAIHYIKKILQYNYSIDSFGAIRKRNSINGIDYCVKYNPPIFESIGPLSSSENFHFYDLILEKNPDLEICNEYGETIISYLIDYHHTYYIKYCNFYLLIDKMIKKGADPNQRNYLDGTNSLHRLCECPKISSNYEKLFDLFLNSGCDINSLNPKGSHALMFSTYHNNPSATKILIEKGSDINISNRYGLTAIIYAVEQGNVLPFDILLDHNAILTNVDIYGSNIFHNMLRSNMHNEYFYIKILERNPELLSMQNKKGETPIDMVQKIEHERTRTSLLSLMSKY